MDARNLMCRRWDALKPSGYCLSRYEPRRPAFIGMQKQFRRSGPNTLQPMRGRTTAKLERMGDLTFRIIGPRRFFIARSRNWFGRRLCLFGPLRAILLHFEIPVQPVSQSQR
jgi:hypothetical protein